MSASGTSGHRSVAGQGRRNQPLRNRLEYQAGGTAREIEVAGGVKTNGAGVAPIEQHGAINSLRVTGGFVAAGGGFDKI